MVLRCLDPRLKKLGTQVLADLTSIEWKGWNVVNRGHQAFLEPNRGHKGDSQTLILTSTFACT